MLSFTSSLRPEAESFVVFVSEKYDYKDKNGILPSKSAHKIDSFLNTLKKNKKDDEITSFDITEKQKCFIVKVKNKYESFYSQELGGKFFTYLKNLKNVNSSVFYLDSLNLDQEKFINFFSEFIFGFNLKSYTFNKYKTENKTKINKKINIEILSSYKKKI